MPIVNQLIRSIENSNAGSSIKRTLQTGTEVEVIKEATKDTVKIIRRKIYGDVFTTTLKKVNGKYVPKKVKEEYIFGLVNIDFKNNGSKHVRIRPCDVKGRASKENNGFFKTSLEENIFAKGQVINSPEKEMRKGKSEKCADVSFLLHLRTIRQNKRYCLPDKNYNFMQDVVYEAARKTSF